jgi:nickel-dependent lactate racemase
VEVTINKRIFDYDLLVIIGPTFPHEVVGFSGGNKYFFPGISGEEMIDSFHWLGALITNPVINGTKYTPVREVIDRAAAMIPREKRCFSLAVKDHRVHGIYFGTPEEAFSEAADLSRELNIVFKKRPFQKVLSCAPKMYADLWTAGKCMYKIEPVVADGGELIIFAPHIKQVSQTHGAEIEKIGYHVRDYFVKQWEKFRHISRGVLAHSTHVRGIGRFENGEEKPRIQVTLATQISEEICRKINLGYRDLKTIDVEEWANREDEGILYVPDAGEILYRLENDPFEQ